MSKSLRSPDHVAFQTVMREARKEAEMTQADLAVRLQKPQSFVAKYENGERRLDVVEFIEIARALSIPPRRLFERLLRAISAPPAE
jgi:transcriptional regulator with XRE-family HTH domain